MKGEYVLVVWPFVQELMEYPWFRTECYLMQGLEGQDHYDSSYFVPKMRIQALGLEGVTKRFLSSKHTGTEPAQVNPGPPTHEQIWEAIRTLSIIETETPISIILFGHQEVQVCEEGNIPSNYQFGIETLDTEGGETIDETVIA
jgi:hypothetical protein